MLLLAYCFFKQCYVARQISYFCKHFTVRELFFKAFKNKTKESFSPLGCTLNERSDIALMLKLCFSKKVQIRDKTKMLRASEAARI